MAQCSAPCLAFRDLLKAQHADVVCRLDAQEQRLDHLLCCLMPSPQSAAPEKLGEHFALASPSACAASGSHIRSADSEATGGDPKRSSMSLRIVDDSDFVAGSPSVATSTTTARARKVKWETSTASSAFDTFFGGMVCLNAATIGLEVQWEVTHGAGNVPQAMRVVNYTYAALFAFELAVRIFLNGCRSFCHSRNRAWNLFDIFLVLSSVLELGFSLVGQDQGAGGGLASMRLLRIVRITRLVRLLRVARLMRFVRALTVLVHSILITLKALVWAMLLLALNIYFFAILFTQTVQEHIIEVGPCLAEDLACVGDRAIFATYWRDLPRSMLTLYASVTGGVDWDVVARPIGSISSFWILVYLLYISVTFFAILNVITGVFCQSAIDGASHDRELVVRHLLEHRQAHIQNVKQQFKEMFRRIDASGDGAITMEEFEAHMTDDIASGFFLLLDIDSSDAYTLFRLLDADGSHEIDADEFVLGCLKLRGPAKSVDLATLRSEHKRGMQKCHLQMRSVQAALQTLSAQLAVVASRPGVRWLPPASWGESFAEGEDGPPWLPAPETATPSAPPAALRPRLV